MNNFLVELASNLNVIFCSGVKVYDSSACASIATTSSQPCGSQISSTVKTHMYT